MSVHPEDPDNPIKFDDSQYMEMTADGGTPVPVPTEPVSGDNKILFKEMKLFQCARNGYLEAAQTLLQRQSCQDEINNADEDGLTPLHYAARYNHFDLVKLLVNSGADVDCEDDEGLTPLMYACRIKRRRKKSKKTKQQLFMNEGDSTAENSPAHPNYSPKKECSTHGKHSIDTDAQTIHYLIDNNADLNHKDDYGLTALHHCAVRGDEVACEQLLTYHHTKALSVHAKDNQKMTPLHTAACQCEHDVARQLIRAGADVRSRDEEMSTPLHEAATVGDTKTAKLMFESCTETVMAQLLTDKDEDGNTALMLAVEAGRYAFVTQCIKRGASLDTTNNWNMTALHLAAIKGDVRIVEYLIENKASIAVLNHEHQTPLHKACLFNNIESIKILLDNNANIESKDKDNFTPLLLAACYGHSAVVKLLMERGADISVEDKNDRTAIYLAAEENKMEALEVLLQYQDAKNLINDKDENSNCPLHAAASLGHLPVVKCLLNNGADLFNKNDMEQTPIHMAAVNGWTNVVREIVRREKNAMGDGDEDSNTALHLAAIGGHYQLVEALLNLGAEPEVRNSALKTPIGCAAATGFLKTVKLLENADALIDTIDKQKMTPLLAAASNGHSDVVEFLLKKKADVTHKDLNGNNCLDLAIIHDHQEVAAEIIDSKGWKNALRTSKLEKGTITTPLRQLIRKMPDIATKVFNKCISYEKPEEGSQESLTVSHKVTYNFEFLDDTYNINTWANDKTPNKMKRKKTKTNLQSVEPIEESIMTSYWNKMNIFTHKGKTLVPYTQYSDEFKRNHPMIIMVDSSREELLDHPLVSALRRHKWITFGRMFYYLSLTFYFIFLFFLTGYVIVTKPPFMVELEDFTGNVGNSVCEKYQDSGAHQPIFARIGKYIILILAFFNMVKEGFQAFHGRFDYLTWENLLEVATYVSSILFCLDFNGCSAATGYRTHWQWNFGACCIVLSWIALVLYIQKFPSLGIYVVMFKYILYTFFKFFIVFLLFIIAFGLGFFCLLQNQTPYSTAYNAIIRTSVMMIGEFDYNDIFHGEDIQHYWTTYVLFCVFLIIMTIIIMNLLVGLAVDDIKGVQEQAALKRIAMKVNLVLDVERVSLRMTSRYFTDTVDRQFDSAEAAAAAIKPSEQFENQIQKSQQKVLKKIDKVKGDMKAVKGNLAKLEDMLEAIMKAQDIKLGEEET